MQEESPKSIGWVAPLEANANGRRSSAAIGRLDLRLVAIKAGRQRRWQLDSRSNGASRQSARALIWKFESNGWDEV